MAKLKFPENFCGGQQLRDLRAKEDLTRETEIYLITGMTQIKRCFLMKWDLMLHQISTTVSGKI